MNYGSAIRFHHRLRPGLALARLALLYVLICFIVLYLGLVLRAWNESDLSLIDHLPPADAAGTDIPMVGATVELGQYDADAREAALMRLENQGIGWVRQRLDWSQLEAAQGDHNWALSDAILRDIVGAGLVPIAVLDGSPPWARTASDRIPHDNARAPPSDPATFARFAAAVADRYGDTLTYYQIWDEPNITPHWGNRHIDPVGYAQLLKSAAGAIRAHDPDAVIVMGALAPTQDRGHMAIDEVYFLQRVYAAGGADAFDVVALQPFGFGYHPDHTRRHPSILNFGRTALVRRAMIAAGDAETPVWAIRYGWNRSPHSPWRTVSASNQLAFVSEAMEITQSRWPWLVTLGWAIDQPDASPDDPIWGFALDESLLRAVGSAGRSLAKTEYASTTRFRFAFFVFSLLMAIVIWRAWWSARLLPWSGWFERFRRTPLSVRLVAWAGLLLIYYYATWPPIIILCWIGAALLIIATPTAGLWLAAVLLPFHIYHKEVDVVDITWIVSPVQALVICTLPAMLLVGWNRIRSSHFAVTRAVLGRLHFLDWMAFTWLGISLSTRLNAWHRPGHYRGMLELVIVPLLLYAAVRLFVNTVSERRTLLVALFTGGLLAASLGISQWFDGRGTEADDLLRLVGPHFSPNHTALYLIRTLFIGLGLLPILASLSRGSARCSINSWTYLTGVVAVGVVVIALALTASRGAWLLGVPAGIIVLFASVLHRPRAGRRRSLVAIPVGGNVAALAALPILVGMGLSIFLLWSRIGNSETLVRRFAIWSATTRLWRDFPLLGVGPGGFFWNYPAYLQPGSVLDPNLRHPHNLWLEFSALWGIVGLTWFCVVLWRMRGYWPKIAAAPELVGALAAAVAALAHAQVDAFGALPDLAAWNWIVLGLFAPAVAGRIRQKNRATNSRGPVSVRWHVVPE